MRAPRPVVVRIPFSHYCRKAEWGLTQAGIAYDTWDMLPAATLRMADITAEGTVPVLYVDDGGDGSHGGGDGRDGGGNGDRPRAPLIPGSDRILRWAAERQQDGNPLYPYGQRDEVQRWEAWADEDVGPVARREAYRVAYNEPGRLSAGLATRVGARVAHRAILDILRYYKVRRFDAADSEAVPAILKRIADGLATSTSGYLVTDRPTAADVAVAALTHPFTVVEDARELGHLDGWAETRAFIDHVKPDRTARRRRRWMTKRHWDALAKADAGAMPSAAPRPGAEGKAVARRRS